MANTYHYDQSGGALHSHATGYVDCDGSTDALVMCGFIPSRVEAFIINTPASTAAWGGMFHWQTPMDTEESSVDHTVAFYPVYATTTPNPEVVDAGITPYRTGEEDSDPGYGFLVDASLLSASDRLFWIAFR